VPTSGCMAHINQTECSADKCCNWWGLLLLFGPWWALRAAFYADIAIFGQGCSRALACVSELNRCKYFRKNSAVQGHHLATIVFLCLDKCHYMQVWPETSSDPCAYSCCRLLHANASRCH
jgi:hypothetical protein